MIGGKTARCLQIKRIIFVFIFTIININISFSQENKKNITEEALNKHIDIISQFYESYNRFGKNEKKALDVFIKDLQTQYIDDAIIESIKHNLIDYKSTELEEILKMKDNSQYFDTLIFFNDKLVSKFLKENLETNFPLFYKNLNLIRSNSINSAKIISANFNGFKASGIIPDRFENYKEYITYRLSNK